MLYLVNTITWCRDFKNIQVSKMHTLNKQSWSLRNMIAQKKSENNRDRLTHKIKSWAEVERNENQ